MSLFTNILLKSWGSSIVTSWVPNLDLGMASLLVTVTHRGCKERQRNPITGQVVRLSAQRTGRLYRPWCTRKDYINEKFEWHHRESNPRLPSLWGSASTNRATPANVHSAVRVLCRVCHKSALSVADNLHSTASRQIGNCVSDMTRKYTAGSLT
jgi:hypothetical protein